MSHEQTRPSNTLLVGSADCPCDAKTHRPVLVAVTGGPGAGKTAVVEMASRALCHHVAIVPEAASIVFGGGFPRGPDDYERKASQRAIFSVQRELETIVLERPTIAVGLCDRGTIDGLAYWPGRQDELFEAFGTTRALELSRYAAVIHLRTPSSAHGYDHSNHLRTESAAEAAAIDAKIADVWRDHPNRVVIESEADFVTKAVRAVEAIRRALPKCCAPTLGPI